MLAIYLTTKANGNRHSSLSTYTGNLEVTHAGQVERVRLPLLFWASCFRIKINFEVISIRWVGYYPYSIPPKIPISLIYHNIIKYPLITCRDSNH